MVSISHVASIAAAVCVTTVSAVHGQDSAGTHVISNVNVVDVQAGVVRPSQTVVVERGRIVSVHASARDLPNSGEIDGTGMYVIPGLWDMHVHLRHPLAPTILMPQFVANGVTGVREMSSDCDGFEGEVCVDRLREWQRAIESGELMGPRLVAMSSFPLNPPWDYEVTEEEARGLVARLAERGVDWIKIYYRLAPPAFRWITDEARKHGMRVGGHIPLRMSAAEASGGGLNSLEHARDFLFDCFPGSAEFRRTATSQNPPMDVMRSMVGDHDVNLCGRAFETLRRNGTWYVPTHVTRRMDAYADDPQFRNDARAKYIPARVWASWQEDADRMVALDSSPEGRRVMRRFYEQGLEITGRAHDAGVNIVLGTDAGDTYVFPGSSVHDELGEFVKAGLSPAEALAAATIRAAEFMNLENQYGTIDVGKRADLVLLSGNPLEDIGDTGAVVAVFLNGRFFDREALDGMLTDVENRVASMSR